MIVGYYDEDGFAYCLKHARDKSEAIHDTDCDEHETCSVCREELLNVTRQAS